MPVAYINQADGESANIPVSLGDAKFCVEASRLNSFNEQWPHDNYSGNLTKENMARAGFFYMGRDDGVKCFCCHIKLIGWDQADEPWDKHLEVAPNCLFAKFRKEEGQLTVDQWLDVLCNRCINLYDNKFNKLIQQAQRILNSNN